MRTSILLLAILAVALASCADETNPLSPPSASVLPDASEETTQPDAAAIPSGPGTCEQASAGQALPQRLITMSATGSNDAGVDGEAGAGSADTVFLVADLWQMYETSCGAPCHDHGGFGNFAIPHATDFPSQMTKDVLGHVTSDGATAGVNPLVDPKDPMPPFSNGGKPYSTRGPTDSIVRFATLVQEWLNQKSPKDSFTVASSPDAGAASASETFALTRATGDTMTLIGNCVPNKALFATDQKRSAALDDLFARAVAMPDASTAAQQIGLPEHLSQTDVFALDSTVLARYGVIGYAPAYPLWSDNTDNGTQTGKLRYVRVPRGTSIQFDKATQKFKIPPNTRFYKTFMKKVVDVDGSVRFRKIETRLIVSRPDVTNADQTVKQTALFGTYKWRSDESDADLEQNALNNGQFFGDDLFTYVEDEQLSPIVRAENPGNPDEAEIAAGSRKHYAIPSSERCVECHEGSPSASFVLGFTPLQINRRPVGQGGITEPAGPDDLTQLQRLLDYGVITGIDSAAEVLPLERLEGTRTPRNNQELVAQGYMVGNCEHCHNPRGFPSVQFPVLADVLNFLPGSTGGIFQFPLEKVSPRIFRGPTQDVPIPYITPSLVDLPPFGWEKTLGAGGGSPYPSYGLKYGFNGGALDYELFAPWRSLIFRNVNTPFTYSDDFALFPHMPMNTPGYDPNAGQIMAEWMVSIPAVRKNPQIAEYAFTEIGTNAVLDDSPQPYVEVKPGDPGYDDAESAAQRRLGILHTGNNSSIDPAPRTPFSYYNYSPDTSDIRDPQVEVSTCQTVPAAPINGASPALDKVGTAHVPDHAHWVITDLTEPQGPWGPRRSDWFSVLIPGPASGDAGADASGGGQVPVRLACDDTNQSAAVARAHEQQVAVDVLQSVTLDKNFQTFATTPVPFGLWQKTSGCSFPNVPTASSFAGGSRPQWMDNPATKVSPNDPVYVEWPGQAVFNMICINCHGSRADGTGRLADNLLTMTGGTVRVANLRDGIFGNAGMNRQPVFDDSALRSVDSIADLPAGWGSASVDDRAARYVAWMGLGGTTAVIPLSILNIVADTSVLGVHRSLPYTAISANMLSAAKALCQSVLAGNPQDGNAVQGRPLNGAGSYSISVTGRWFSPDPMTSGVYLNNDHELIAANGDAELWLRLCSVDNPPPVRVVVKGTTDTWIHVSRDDATVDHLWSPDFVRPEIYGSSPVGNDRGTIDPNGIVACTDMTTPCNLRPWCVPGSSDRTLPACPTAVASAAPTLPGASNGCLNQTTDCWSLDDADRWATRGAINAGLAVFVYLDALAKGTALSQPDYTQCQLLH